MLRRLILPGAGDAAASPAPFSSLIRSLLSTALLLSVSFAATPAALALPPCSEAAGAGWCVARRIAGDVPGGELGFRFGSPLDADGDGKADIAAGSRFKFSQTVYKNGFAAVWSGATGAKIREWDGELTDALFGHYVLPLGDLDGDSLADLVTSAPNATIQGVRRGAVSARSPKTGNVLWRKFGARDALMGWHLAPAGDQNGDGVTDVFVGSPTGTKGGRVYLLSGKDGTELREYAAPASKASFGWYLSDTDDLDSDGKRDLLVGNLSGPVAPGDPLNEVYLISSATGRVLHQWKDEDTRHSFGEVVSYAGDLDGDGSGDVLVASPCTGRGGDELTGHVQAFSGKTGRELKRWDGKQKGEIYGRMVTSAGDVNGDRIDDVAIGAPWHRIGDRARVGRAEIRSGKDGAVLAEWFGDMGDSWFGWHIRKAPDPDGLGRPSLLVGSLRQTVSGAVGTGVIDWVVLRPSIDSK